MTIIRVSKQRGEFSVLPKAAINDSDLSWEARGVLLYLLEKPDGWQVKAWDLVRRGPAKEAKIRRILAELENAGYIRRERYNQPDGTFRWTSVVYETPRPPGTISPYCENRSMVEALPPYLSFPHVGEPFMANPHVENHQIYQYPLATTTLSTTSRNNTNTTNRRARAKRGDDNTNSGNNNSSVNNNSGHNTSGDNTMIESSSQTGSDGGGGGEFPTHQRQFEDSPGEFWNEELEAARSAVALQYLLSAAPDFAGARRFVSENDPEQVARWALYVLHMAHGDIRNPAGLIHKRVSAGDWPELPGELLDRFHTDVAAEMGVEEVEL